VRREAEALAAEGASVEMICIRKDDSESKHEEIAGVKVTRLNIRHLRGGMKDYVLTYGRFLITVGMMLAGRSFSRRYDLVQFHNMPDFLVAAGLVPRLLGAKLILDLHDPVPELFESLYEVPSDHRMVRMLKLIEKWSIHFSHLALTPNIAFRDIFVSRGCPPQKMKIVMNSPKSELFRPREERDVPRQDGQAFRVVHHGSIVERHGLDLAVRAVAEALNTVPNLRFEIYGRRTPFLEVVLSLARELKISDRVIYGGEKTMEEIAVMVSEVDLGLVPNRRNSFTEINMPTRLFEYMAFHKPVIAPSTKGIRDYFDTSSILFFEPGDASSLARQIVWAAQHEEETKKIVAKGHQVYLDHLWDREKENFVQLVTSLVGRGDAR
jgi:glycosyltransferase involved in cell wall biosynthesis